MTADTLSYDCFDNFELKEDLLARPSVTFKKRQREFAKRDKRKQKEAKRAARKAHRSRNDGPPVEMISPSDLGLPHLEFIRSEEHRLPPEMIERYAASA